MGRTVKSRLDSRRALLFGLGYTAKALIAPLKALGYDITGTVRSKDKAAELAETLNIDTIVFNGSATDRLDQALSATNVIISSIPPADNGQDPVLAVMPDMAERAAHCDWAGYLSATSVYGDRGGHWVCEDENLFPGTKRGRNRIETELAWLESGLPVHIFRLAGIYGPDLYGQSRNAFDRLQMGRAKAVVKDGHVVNRIFVEDIARAVTASLERPDPCQVYNISDGHPAPPQDVLDFAADLIGEPRVPHQALETAELSPMARSFYAETKRVDNSRARKDLGWHPEYPTYQAGLCEIYRRQIFGPKAVVLAGHMIVQDTDLEAVRRALPAHKDATLAEPGCLRFDVFPDLKTKNKFHVFEAFTSKAAFKAHQSRIKGTQWERASASAKRFYTVRKGK